MESAAVRSPEDAVYERAARLLAVQHAVAEICGGRKVETDPKALKDAVLLIRSIVRKIDGAYATFIGGLAVQELGYERWTDDVDVVVDAAHYSEVMDCLRESGFQIVPPKMFLQNKDTGAKVDLLKEGVKLKDAKYPLPHPSELGPNAGFAKISAIVRLKLDAHRRQDLADIVAIMKRHLNQADTIASELPEGMRAQFLELADEARRETE